MSSEPIPQERDHVPGRWITVITIAAVLTGAAAVGTAYGLLRDRPKPAESVGPMPREIGSEVPIDMTSIGMEDYGLRLRQQQKKQLSEYGWVDKSKGVAHIPIDEAIRIVAAEGAP